MRWLDIMLTIFLISVGIFEKGKKYEKIYLWWYTITCTTAIFGSLMSLVTLSEDMYKMQTFSTTLPQICILISFVYFHCRRDDIRNLLNTLRTNSHNDGSKIIYVTENYIKIKFTVWFVVHLVFASSYVTPSAYILFTQDEVTERAYVIPFWYYCGSFRNRTLLRYLCWEVESRGELMFSNGIQAMIVAICYYVYCTPVIIYTIVMANIWIHLQELKARIRRFAITTDIFFSNGTCREMTRKGEGGSVEEFYEIIKYQQFLRKYCLELIHVLYGYVFLFVVQFTSSVTFVIFTIMIEKNNNYVIAYKMFVLAVSGIIVLMMHCQYGEIISELNGLIFEELREIPWYEKSFEFRRIYAIVLAQTQVPLRLTFGGMADMNLRFFMTCTRTIYSIVNVILIKLAA